MSGGKEVNMNTIVVIIIAVLLLSALLGMKAGFIKTVFSMFSMITALLLTIWISPYISKYMQSNDKVIDYFNDKVVTILHFEDIAVKTTEQDNFISELPLPESFKKSLLDNNTLDVYKALNVSSFTEYITRAATNVIINAIAFIGTFITLIIILKILCIVLDIMSKLPILHSINTAGGLIVGVLRGAMLLWLFFILVTAFGSMDLGKSALATINDSTVLSFLYDNNFIMKYITGLKL